jgi:hypothetical protein
MVLVIRGHQPENLEDESGRPHPNIAKNYPSFWGRIVPNVVSAAYIHLETFSELRKQAETIRQLMMQYAQNISPALPPPRQLLDAMLKFQYHLSEASNSEPVMMKDCLPAPPPWRRYFERTSSYDRNGNSIIIYDRIIASA